MFSISHDAAPAGERQIRRSFVNPIAPGADPWVIKFGGYYYWCTSDRDLGVAVHRSCSLTSLGEKSIVWRSPEKGPYSRQVWAPELHRLDGRWYIYVAASNGRNETHRMIVLEGTSDDPTGEFRFKAELYTGDDLRGRTRNRWAIDGTVLEHEGRRYLLWSGWHDERDEQGLYIAPLANPWTLSAARVRLCANDDHLWERVGDSSRGRGLNEGPQVLQRAGRVFVVYSCSGSWEPSYKLGMLELSSGGDPLDPSAWRKHARPVFEQTTATFGVGHCSFVTSPDGAEDWIVYHAKVSREHGWQRILHAQPFTWDASGLPDFGVPLGATVELPRPSGELATGRRDALKAARPLVERIRVTDTAGEASGERVTAG